MAGRILIVDGIATNRILHKARLEAAGHSVSQAADAEAALRLARAAAPDLAIVGAGVPADRQLALCRQLRALRRTHDMPVLVRAAEAGAAFRAAALAAGAAEVLGREATDAVVMGWVRHLLRRHAQLRELADLEALIAPEDRVSPRCRPSDAGEGPAEKGRIALVGDRPEGARARRALAAALAPHLCRALPARAAAQSLAGADDTDLIVIDAAGVGNGAGGADAAEAVMELVSLFRTLPATRHTPLVVLAASGSASETVRLLDSEIADLVSDAAPLTEQSTRILRALAEGFRHARARAALRSRLRLSMVDPLTGLFNRRPVLGLLERLAAGGPPAGRRQEPFAVLMIDIDHFKRINDRHGHPAGDAVLRQVARRLRAGLRRGDMLCRYGGEEFLAVLPGADIATAQAVAERLRTGVAAPPIALPDGGATRATVSIGIATSAPPSGGPDAGDLPATLIARADRALLRAKAGGRNAVSLDLDRHAA